MKPDLRNVVFRFSRRPQEPRPLHFLHIGKTGGTALRHALKHAPVETGTYSFRMDPGHEKKLRDVPPGEAAFFFVRDPITRFVSGFYSRQRQGMPNGFHPWKEHERQAFAAFETANALAEAISGPSRDVRFEARQAMRAIGHVNTKYARWLESPRYVRSRRKDILLIGRQETLSADFERLKALSGLSPEVSLPVDDVQAHRNPSHVDRTLSGLALANLTDWYREDFAFLDALVALRLLPALAPTRRA